jgi:hypothetical protein
MGRAPRKPVRTRLSAGGRWIRTFGSRTRHQAVRPRRGRFPVIGSSPHSPGGTGIFEPPAPSRVDLCVRTRTVSGTCTKAKAQVGGPFRAEPKVRIHLPPAESLSLGRIHFRRSRTPAFRAGVRGWFGDRVGRDAPRVSIARQPAAISRALREGVKGLL